MIMGATGWKYIVPYEPDISVALSRLRKRVFAQGDYVLGDGVDKAALEQALAEVGSDWESELQHFERQAADPRIPIQARRRTAELVERLKRIRESGSKSSNRSKPQTIDELLEIQGAAGTHSILDTVRISPHRGFGSISPIPRDVLTKLFGSDRPSRNDINDRYDDGSLEMYVNKPWSGIYIVAYKNDVPDEIVFAGCSGD